MPSKPSTPDSQAAVARPLINPPSASRPSFENQRLRPTFEEFQCNTKNDWDKFVLYALLKRYGIKSYRYRKQRKSTILVRVSKGFMNDVLWPIFTNTADELYSRFTAITTTLLPSIATGPFSMAVLDHDHSTGQLCENCRKRLLEEGAGQSVGQMRRRCRVRHVKSRPHGWITSRWPSTKRSPISPIATLRMTPLCDSRA